MRKRNTGAFDGLKTPSPANLRGRLSLQKEGRRPQLLG